MRPQFFPAIILPVLLGTSYAWKREGVFNPWTFLLTLSAALLYHGGMNVMNDFFDYRNGADNINRTPLTPFTGGSRMIQKGLITPEKTLAFAIALLFSGSLIGLYISYALKSWFLPAIGIFGLLSGFFYSAPPLFLAGRGLGEALVGINFGVLSVAGSYLVQNGHIDPEVVWASLPISFLVAGILYVNEFPDYEADRLAGKKNLVVRFGPRLGRFAVPLIMACAYISLLACVATGIFPLFSLTPLVSAYFGIKASCGIMKNYERAALLIPPIKSTVLAHLITGLSLVISQII